MALAVAAARAGVFARAARRPVGSGLPAYAMGFVPMLPGPVGWGSAVLALGCGAVFGRATFGGRVVLPPALVGLAYAIDSFPTGGFEPLRVPVLKGSPRAACRRRCPRPSRGSGSAGRSMQSSSRFDRCGCETGRRSVHAACRHHARGAASWSMTGGA